MWQITWTMDRLAAAASSVTQSGPHGAAAMNIAKANDGAMNQHAPAKLRTAN